MIYSLDRFNHILRDSLLGISVTNRNHRLELTSEHIFYGVPEAEVIESRTYPAISFHMINDSPLEANRLQGDEYEVLVNEGTDVNSLPWAERWQGVIPEPPFYAKWPYPEPVRLMYQFDMYAQSQQGLIQLYTGFIQRFPRRRGFLLDDDNHEIQFLSNQFLDFTRDVDMLGETKERSFRRTLTYTFDVWLQLADIPDRLVKRIETVQLEYFSKFDGDVPDITDLVTEDGVTTVE